MGEDHCDLLLQVMMKTLMSGLVVLGVVAMACGPTRAETPASPKLTQMCDSLCGKRASCEKGFEASACKTRCTTYEALRRIEAFRGDAGDRILECVNKDACAADLGEAAKRCANEIGKTLPVSDKAKALCAKLEPQFRDCNIAWETPCTQELSFYEPADLGVFDECVDRQCRGGRACFAEAEHALLSKHSH